MSESTNPQNTAPASSRATTETRPRRNKFFFWGGVVLVIAVLAIILASAVGPADKNIKVAGADTKPKDAQNAYDEAAAIATRSLSKGTEAPPPPVNVMAGVQNGNRPEGEKKTDGFPEVPPVAPPALLTTSPTSSPVYEKGPSQTQTNPTGEANPTGVTGAGQGNADAKPALVKGSGRSSYYYNYYQVGEEEKPASQPTTPTVAPTTVSNASMPPRSEAAVKPPFGTQIPVRTLGVTYSFRNNSFVRMEVMRDVKGEGWSIPRGAQVVGRLQSSIRDRVYVQSIGYIDPKTNRLVRFGGEILGRDGGAGLPGERKRLDSRVGFILNRILNSATQLGNSFLLGRRGNGGILVPPFNPNETAGAFNTEIQNGGPQFYVRVNGGTTGYLMVTDLPPADDAQDAERLESDGKPARTDFTQADLDLILTAGDPNELRAILAQLPPALRAEVERQLNQPK